MADADALRYLAETAAANAASQASTQTAAALQNLHIQMTTKYKMRRR